jgi:gamma-glutamyltranspeptidase/glutathione hydrolase
MVASADHLASMAGSQIFERGGNAVDAAVATNAVMAVVAPHMCGIGGDLFALVHTGRSVAALNASGRAGSGADAKALRSEGHSEIPMRHDIRAVTVPGCVDGWTSLHERFGSMPLLDLFEAAIDLADNGFPTSPLLLAGLSTVDQAGLENLESIASQATHVGALVRRPGVAGALRAVAADGRNGLYAGEFGQGLIALGGGLFSERDLKTSQSGWVDSLKSEMFGVDVHTIGPNSQGYLLLGSGVIASALDLPDDPDDSRWPHLLIEASKLAGYDRQEALHEGADGAELVAEIAERRHLLSPDRAASHQVPGTDGDTTYLCTAEIGGMAVSLIQSNASGFGSWLVEPNTGINLHNRGLGFNLVEGHPAEFGPGRRPPHTLSPALATKDSDFVAVFGTQGGDAQPQILLQLAARLFSHGQPPAKAINAPRWALAGPATGFDTWTSSEQTVRIEADAPGDWESSLTQRGHQIEMRNSFESGFGHAHVIMREAGGVLAAAADPRAKVSAAIGR